jgi:SAM-dependent methyltransferase
MLQPGNQVRFWDNLPRTKIFSHPLDLGRFRRYVPETARILDFGCGYGRILAELYDRGYRCAQGLDFSPGMLAWAREKFPFLDLILMEGPEIPAPEGSFDAVLVFSVLTCNPDDTDQERIMSEVFRVLRPGGILYLSDYLLQDDPRNLERYGRFRSQYGCYGVFELTEGAVLRHHDPAWIAYLTSRFENLDLYGLEVPTMNGNTARAFQFFGRKPGEASVPLDH